MFPTPSTEGGLEDKIRIPFAYNLFYIKLGSCCLLGVLCLVCLKIQCHLSCDTQMTVPGLTNITSMQRPMFEFYLIFLNIFLLATSY